MTTNTIKAELQISNAIVRAIIERRPFTALRDSKGNEYAKPILIA